MSEGLERLLETHTQVIREQEQPIQNQRLVNEKLEIEVRDLHAVIQRLNAARRRVPADVSGGVRDKSNAGVDENGVRAAVASDGAYRFNPLTGQHE